VTYINFDAKYVLKIYIYAKQAGPLKSVITNIHDIRTNKINSKFGEHTLETGHSYFEDTIQVLHTIKKGIT
jgi:hypothetical protein